MASGYGWWPDADQRWTRSARTFGYLTSALVNVALLWVAHQLLDWGWPRFLTDDFTLVLGVVTVSFVLTAATDVVLAVFDDRGVRALVDLARAVVGLWVAVRFWRVFPFDWSGEATDWSVLARVVIAAAALGTSLGIVGGVVRVVRVVVGAPPVEETDVVDDQPTAQRPPVGTGGQQR